MNWDDLRYVLVVAEQGSLAAAAQTLGVNRTTVLRRISAFEERLDVRLFERDGSHYIVTGEAQDLLAAAHLVEGAVNNLERKIVGRDLRLEGTIRVTTTDSIMEAVVMPHLASFRARYPHIRLELLISRNLLSLEKRDADVAIRTSYQPPENAQSLSGLAFGIYASPHYLPSAAIEHVDAHRWLCMDVSMLESTPGRWTKAHIPDSAVYLRADSFLALRDAAERGLGLALLPCCAAAASPFLHRVISPLPTLSTNLWLLIHEDLQRAARVRALVDHLKQEVGAQRDFLEGRAAA